MLTTAKPTSAPPSTPSRRRTPTRGRRTPTSCSTRSSPRPGSGRVPAARGRLRSGHGHAAARPSWAAGSRRSSWGGAGGRGATPAGGVPACGGGHGFLRDLAAGRPRPTTWSTPPPPGTGSTRRCATERAHEVLRPGGHLAFWRADHVVPGRRRPVLRRDPGGVRRDRRGRARRPRVPRARRAARPARRDRGERAVRGDRGAALRLGDDLRRRRLPCAARHVLRAHRDGGSRPRGTCTARSAAAWPCGPTVCSGGTGAPSSTWPARSPERARRLR